MIQKINRKTLVIFAFVIFFFGGINFVSATVDCGPDLGIFCNVISVDSLSGAIMLVIKYLLTIVGLLSLLFLVIGGIKYILSSGNEEKMKSAKDATYSAGLGLAIALMAYGMLELINNILRA